MAPRPLTLRHVALNVVDLEQAETFYCGVLGYRVEWRPDPDNLYLTSSGDNLALHRVAAVDAAAKQRLDHVGFAVASAEEVDAWAARLTSAGHPPEQAPKTHRDGARSLYVRAPDGTLLQIIHHPPIQLA